MPLADKRKINLAIHVKKALEQKSPENIQNLYLKQQSLQKNRATEKRILQQYQEGTFYTSIKAWNAVPTHLKNTTLTTLKKKPYKPIQQNNISKT